MTGYESKKAMARDKLLELAQEGMSMHSHDAPEYIVCEALIEALAQPTQEPVAWRTFDGEGGYDYRSYEDNENYADNWDKRNPKHKGWVDPLYTAPTQRPWVEPRGDEWFNWWRVSKIADETEAEIDFADFITIALAVSAKLKEKNNG